MNKKHQVFPKLTVIVPVYNSENYAANCIRSLVNQTYTHLEIILIDDGSTDSSLQICKSFARDDARIKVLTKENGGQSSARNLGLDMVTGEFIAFIDSDDEISLDVFENAVYSFEKYPEADVVQFPVFMDYGTPAQYLNLKKEQLVTGRPNLFREWIEKGNVSWIVCNKIFRREIFNELRFRKMYFEDNIMVAEVLDKIDSLYIMEDGIYYYFMRENSTTTSPHSLQKELDTYEVCGRIYKSLKKYNLQSALVTMQSRMMNVAKSLRVNHNLSADISTLCKDIKISNVLVSTVPLKEKVKLLLFKYR